MYRVGYNTCISVAGPQSMADVCANCMNHCLHIFTF